ncbi:hypothetical protein [Nocardioides sp.]|uniref:hypothetical protein n=1 Tax=Nocardioides sp. TaxID=35761 RepID=UPI00261FC98E|nr:hypothetical protein [Nocardioides sp.]
MTATIVSLDSRRPAPPPACGCTRHLLDALASRTAARLQAHDLLIPRDVLERVLADITHTTVAVLDGTPPTERTNP